MFDCCVLEDFQSLKLNVKKLQEKKIKQKQQTVD